MRQTSIAEESHSLLASGFSIYAVKASNLMPFATDSTDVLAATCSNSTDLCSSPAPTETMTPMDMAGMLRRGQGLFSHARPRAAQNRLRSLRRDELAGLTDARLPFDDVASDPAALSSQLMPSLHAGAISGMAAGEHGRIWWQNAVRHCYPASFRRS